MFNIKFLILKKALNYKPGRQKLKQRNLFPKNIFYILKLLGFRYIKFLENFFLFSNLNLLHIFFEFLANLIYKSLSRFTLPQGFCCIPTLIHLN